MRELSLNRVSLGLLRLGDVETVLPDEIGIANPVHFTGCQLSVQDRETGPGLLDSAGTDQRERGERLAQDVLERHVNRINVRSGRMRTLSWIYSPNTYITRSIHPRFSLWPPPNNADGEAAVPLPFISRRRGNKRRHSKCVGVVRLHPTPFTLYSCS